MPSKQFRPSARPVVFLVTFACLASARAGERFQFRVTLDKSVAEVGITGRLFVFLDNGGRSEPRFGPNWFHPEPFFGVDVKRFEPGQTRSVDDSAAGFPDKLSRLPPGKYRVQALLDHDFYNPHHARGPGNFYSDVATLELNPAAGGVASLTLNHVVKPRPFPTTRFVKEVVFKSELLSKFHGRKVIDRCGVVLPASYHGQPRRRYPVIYTIPGFGGSHVPRTSYARGGPRPGRGEAEFIRVFLSGRAKWGHHVYADSATNGPRGQSLIEELVPIVDGRFRTVAQPTARFLTGHSSGGWSSLWLQVSYPDTFGGVWSTSPDPVDFRDYQQVDLYADPPLSLYRDGRGGRRPIARRGDRPVLWYDSFGKMDDCLGRGGQLRSFEAVFSPKGADGKPMRLWDRKTGRIDAEVARAWRKYDIRLKIERNWKDLEPKLAGKLHIFMGSKDTFYLEGAVRLLGQSLNKLGSDATVEVIPGASHSSLLTSSLYGRIRREMSSSFFKHHGG